jgi:chromosome segregation ATPase
VIVSESGSPQRSVEAAEAELEQRVAELDRTTQALRKAVGDCDTANVAATAATVRVTQLEGEIRDLEGELRRSAVDAATLSESHARTQAAIEAERRAIELSATLKRRSADLERSVAELTSNCEAAESRDQDTERLEMKCHRLTSDLAQTRRLLTEKHNDLDIAVEEISELVTNRTHLAASLDESQRTQMAAESELVAQTSWWQAHARRAATALYRHLPLVLPPSASDPPTLLMTAVESATSRVIELEEETKTQDTRAVKLTRQVVELKSEVGAMRGLVGVFEAQSSTFDSALAELRADLIIWEDNSIDSSSGVDDADDETGMVSMDSALLQRLDDQISQTFGMSSAICLTTFRVPFRGVSLS